MRRAALAAALLLICGAAQAAPLELYVPLTAQHFGKSVRPLNQLNLGLGLGMALRKDIPGHWQPYALAAGFDDSFHNPTWLAGAGLRRHWDFGPVRAQIGGLAAIIQRPDINQGSPFPGVVPIVGIGMGPITLEATFIPRIKALDDERTRMIGNGMPVAFFWLRASTF